MKLDQLLSQGFQEAIVSLSKKTSGKGSFKLAKMRKKVADQLALFDIVNKGLQEKHCKLDENEQLIYEIKDGKSIVHFKSVEDAKVYQEELKAALDTDINFEEKMSLKDFKEDPDANEVFFMDALLIEE